MEFGSGFSTHHRVNPNFICGLQRSYDMATSELDYFFF
jgi:hypothetical protein